MANSPYSATFPYSPNIQSEVLLKPKGSKHSGCDINKETIHSGIHTDVPTRRSICLTIEQKTASRPEGDLMRPQGREQGNPLTRQHFTQPCLTVRRFSVKSSRLPISLYSGRFCQAIHGLDIG
ncbi:hypothetical protein NCU16449 [Neurospora crassa OR74A]|uniref:Uncharacterized protein n=1 Tax=Neurospora crassa (strain ATCC 24698 / 74-OR23-1A / CBS 708.71 / DSM 1257 / FGSC 987) TaxID=367110 RepID=V5IRQ9_NEUCR|nr:hypothetical protein NCU16449 [Neurospora crassa OR74A]ESA44306.1 hypothetical protein NCU16449 [Neurospora crassa OR74A]|eukprot:XP_011393419.1 hypothetical protein NCU16449 [Neurospora crassa OR74A]